MTQNHLFNPFDAFLALMAALILYGASTLLLIGAVIAPEQALPAASSVVFTMQGVPLGDTQLAWDAAITMISSTQIVILILLILPFFINIVHWIYTIRSAEEPEDLDTLHFPRGYLACMGLLAFATFLWQSIANYFGRLAAAKVGGNMGGFAHSPEIINTTAVSILSVTVIVMILTIAIMLLTYHMRQSFPPLYPVNHETPAHGDR